MLRETSRDRVDRRGRTDEAAERRIAAWTARHERAGDRVGVHGRGRRLRREKPPCSVHAADEGDGGRRRAVVDGDPDVLGRGHARMLPASAIARVGRGVTTTATVDPPRARTRGAHACQPSSASSSSTRSMRRSIPSSSARIVPIGADSLPNSWRSTGSKKASRCQTGRSRACRLQKWTAAWSGREVDLARDLLDDLEPFLLRGFRAGCHAGPSPSQVPSRSATASRYASNTTGFWSANTTRRTDGADRSASRTAVTVTCAETTGSRPPAPAPARGSRRTGGELSRAQDRARGRRRDCLPAVGARVGRGACST